MFVIFHITSFTLQSQQVIHQKVSFACFTSVHYTTLPPVTVNTNLKQLCVVQPVLILLWVRCKSPLSRNLSYQQAELELKNSSCNRLQMCAGIPGQSCGNTTDNCTAQSISKSTHNHSHLDTNCCTGQTFSRGCCKSGRRLA